MAKLCLGLATSHLAHIVNARNLGDPKQVAIFEPAIAASPTHSRKPSRT